MTDDTNDWKTIRVPADVYENAKERKEAWDVTWGEYVSPHKWHSVFDAPNDAPPEVDAQIDSQLRGVGVDEEVYEEIRKLQELIEQMPATTAEHVRREFEENYRP